jgi:hypothetical protein
VLFSVVVLLPLSGALLVVVVLVDFCVTSGDGDASAPGEVSVVVVVVVSFVGPWQPTIIVPAMKAKTVTAAGETIYFEIFMGREYQNSMILHGLKPWGTLICLSENLDNFLLHYSFNRRIAANAAGQGGGLRYSDPIGRPV